MDRKKQCQRGYKMSANGTCIPIRKDRHRGALTSLGSGNNRMAMGGRVPTRRNQIPKPPSLMRRGKQNPGAAPTMDCVALCQLTYGYGPGQDSCTSGVYSGITSCECACCNASIITQTTNSWFPWDGSSLDGAYTQCNCSPCYFGYSDCIHNCTGKNVPEMQQPDKEFRRGGGIKRYARGGRISYDYNRSCSCIYLQGEFPEYQCTGGCSNPGGSCGPAGGSCGGGGGTGGGGWGDGGYGEPPHQKLELQPPKVEIGAPEMQAPGEKDRNRRMGGRIRQGGNKTPLTDIDCQQMVDEWHAKRMLCQGCNHDSPPSYDCSCWLQTQPNQDGNQPKYCCTYDQNKPYCMDYITHEFEAPPKPMRRGGR